MVKIYSAFDTPPDEGIGDFPPTLSQQQFKDECDINVIMDRYTATGQAPQFVGAFFDDFSDVREFHEAQNILLAAQEEFLSLPARVRERFNNDPGRLLEFVNDEANREEAAKLGLLSRNSAPLDVTVTTDTNTNSGEIK